MATVELATLDEILDADERLALAQALKEIGAPELEIDDDAEDAVLDANLDDNIFVTFHDQLDAGEAAADIYLPLEYDDVFEVGDFRFGSAQALLLALDELREELGVEDTDDDFEEEEGGGEDGFESLEDLDEEPTEPPDGGLLSEEEGAEELKDEHMQHIWRVLNTGAKICINRSLCLIIRQ